MMELYIVPAKSYDWEYSLYALHFSRIWKKKREELLREYLSESENGHHIVSKIINQECMSFCQKNHLQYREIQEPDFGRNNFHGMIDTGIVYLNEYALRSFPIFFARLRPYYPNFLLFIPKCIAKTIIHSSFWKKYWKARNPEEDVYAWYSIKDVLCNLNLPNLYEIFKLSPNVHSNQDENELHYYSLDIPFTEKIAKDVLQKMKNNDRAARQLELIVRFCKVASTNGVEKYRLYWPPASSSEDQERGEWR